MISILLLSLVFSFADSLYNEGDYSRAITEYKRILFAQLVDTPQAFYGIGMSHKASGRYGESVLYFKEAFTASLPESLEEKFSLELADAYLRNLAYPLARLELEGIENPRARRLYAVSYLLEANFMNAGAHLDELADPDGELRAIAREGKRLRLLNEDRMVICSALLPGSGQVLSGHPTDGILSFLLTTSSGFLVYESLRKRRFLDASLVFGQLFWRFYTGNIRNTYKLAKEENIKRKRMLLKSSRLVREYLE